MREPSVAAVILLTLLLAAGIGVAVVPRASALEIGKPAPDFELPSTSGATVSLRQFRGRKAVLIEFIGAAFAPT